MVIISLVAPIKEATDIAVRNQDTIQWVLRGGLGFLLTMVVYFLKQQVDVIKMLGLKMDKALIHIQKNSDGLLNLAKDTAKLENRVDDHARRLESHSKDISSLKTKVGL